MKIYLYDHLLKLGMKKAPRVEMLYGYFIFLS
nr:MAG TPA: Single-stranded DNA-binding protein 2 single strand DNA binding.52A [Bacteriophage sp.]